MPATLTGDPNVAFDATLDNINTDGSTVASPSEMNSRYQKLLNNLAVLKGLADTLEGDLSSLGISDISGLQAALNDKASASNLAALSEQVLLGNIWTVSHSLTIISGGTLGLSPGQRGDTRRFYARVPSGKRLVLKRVRFRVGSASSGAEPYLSIDARNVTPPGDALLNSSSFGSGNVPTHMDSVQNFQLASDAAEQTMLIVRIGNESTASSDLDNVAYTYSLTLAIEDA